jgi:hypothetical protein
MNDPSTQDNASAAAPGYVIRGAREIGAYMGVSPATITRWRKRFRGSEEPHLCFPAINIPTGIGRGWELMTHTDLILEWMRRWSEIDTEALRQKPKQWRPRKTKRLGETDIAPMTEKNGHTYTRAGDRNRRDKGG